MIRRRVALLAVAAAVALLPGRAAAQFFPQQQYNPQLGTSYNPQFQPTMTPYLNMFRGNAAVNYYGATRGAIPSFQQNYLNTQFGTSLMDLQRRQAQPGELGEELPLLPGTGHVTAFGYYAPYYNFNTVQRGPSPILPPQPSGGARRSSKQ
jgi:hypothetical protein